MARDVSSSPIATHAGNHFNLTVTGETVRRQMGAGTLPTTEHRSGEAFAGNAVAGGQSNDIDGQLR